MIIELDTRKINGYDEAFAKWTHDVKEGIIDCMEEECTDDAFVKTMIGDGIDGILGPIVK